MHPSLPGRCLLLFLSLVPFIAFAAPAEPPAPMIAPAINSLGLDLYRQQVKAAGDKSVLLSPYSIATALAMTYAGADGATKAEMQRVLGLPADPAASSAAFQALSAELAEIVRLSIRQVAGLRVNGGDATPLELTVANRLFVQRGYALRPEFVSHVARHFDSGLAELDFRSDAARARESINAWVAEQTHDRIRNLLPAGLPVPSTRLALVNALYLKAAWQDEFRRRNTKPEPFHLSGAAPVDVPMMQAQHWMGHAKRDGYSVVTLPYLGGKLQFVLLVPDAKDGLGALEQSLTARALTDCARLDRREVNLHLPRFKLAPATMPLKDALQGLGMKTAFNLPHGSANFDRMAPRTPDEYLFIGDVFHKTWLSLDEQGTEAAAATAVMMRATLGVSARPDPTPVEVRADRPFLFAIQHVNSGVCLFLGRVTDPR
jgi:serpin B